MLLSIAIGITLVGGMALIATLIWASRQTRPNGARSGQDALFDGLYLNATLGQRQAWEIPLHKDRVTTIGRERDNIVVLDHTQVSRYHARIFFDGSRWMLEDINSANGTFLNQRPVARGAVMPGDTLQIGGARLEIRPARQPALARRLATHTTIQQPATSTSQQTFGPFTVIRTLGEGGIGRVLLARDMRDSQRLVALKLLHKQNHYLTKKFQQEGALRLNHPHITRVFETGEIAGNAYILLEYVDGVSLRKLLTGQPWPVDAALTVIEQVLMALDYAHSAGIIHRDIKPENIMISPEQGVKVIDFGIAKDLGAATHTQHMLLGTPYYMSYEQAMGLPVNISSDLYSTAIVLYELLTASVPFNAPESFAVIWQHQRTPAPAPRRLNPAIPAHVEECILLALEKDPARRFKTAAEFAKALGCPLNQPLPQAFGGQVASLIAARRMSNIQA